MGKGARRRHPTARTTPLKYMVNKEKSTCLNKKSTCMVLLILVSAFVVTGTYFLGAFDKSTTGQSHLPFMEKVRVLQSIPHNTSSFTQGLEFDSTGTLWESTGLWGTSSIQQVDLSDGSIQIATSLPNHLFGEGLTIWKGLVFYLTWRSQKVFVYDPKDFTIVDEFSWLDAKEGWGLTHNDDQLIASDGTSWVYFMDYKPGIGFEVTRRLQVLMHQNEAEPKPVSKLNELEWHDGFLLANVWMKSFIVRIDPTSGFVSSIIDLSELSLKHTSTDRDAVLNGIAQHPKTGNLFVTGKRWSAMYEVALEQE